MSDPITYPCGCVNATDPSSGVLRSASKCPGHEVMRREAGELGRDYYEALGAIVGGVPQCAKYLVQIEEALGFLPTARAGMLALEVGCGCSMYAPAILRHGYHYTGLDPSRWAREWTASAFDVDTLPGTLDNPEVDHDRYHLILCAHAFEHMPDAPGAIRRCGELLAPGGELWVVVPDDEDPVNPDHIYFFDLVTLGRCLTRAGLEVEKMTVRRYVKHESFLYARARKPA